MVLVRYLNPAECKLARISNPEEDFAKNLDFKGIKFPVKVRDIHKILLANDVVRTSPKGPLKILTSGTYRGLSGNSQGANTKIDDSMKKLFFSCNSPSITHLFLFFTGRTNIKRF